MSNVKNIWAICSIFHGVDHEEVTISQEAYLKLEDARSFCENRHNGQVYDLDDFTFVSEPDERNTYYEYKILNITVK